MTTPSESNQAGHSSGNEKNKQSTPVAAQTPTKRPRKLLVLVVLAVAIAGGVYWWMNQEPEGFPGIASGNGRIEATQVDVAAKAQGRVEEVLVKEGDMVKEGQVLARMDAAVLRAQLHEAEAAKRQAEEQRNVAVEIAKQRENEHELAQKDLERSQQLAQKNSIVEKQLDADVTKERTTGAVWAAARAQVTSAGAAIESAAAQIERIKTEINDTILTSPRPGRVEYRLVEPGEVIGAGGKVVTLVDITDVYLTLFLPTSQAGKVALGGDARIVLDALPGLPIPAKVSFVSPTAQFTPKEVETRTEREKLMFRVKLRIDPALLQHYAERVKTGLPGTGYVKIDANVAWPEQLRTREERGLPLPAPEDLK